MHACFGFFSHDNAHELAEMPGLVFFFMLELKDALGINFFNLIK